MPVYDQHFTGFPVFRTKTKVLAVPHRAVIRSAPPLVASLLPALWLSTLAPSVCSQHLKFTSSALQDLHLASFCLQNLTPDLPLVDVDSSFRMQTTGYKHLQGGLFRSYLQTLAQVPITLLTASKLLLLAFISTVKHPACTQPCV